MQRLGLEPETFQIQTVDSTAAPGPPFIFTSFQYDINHTYVNIKQDLPSQPFFDEYKTRVGLSVKHTSSTPYFLLLIVFKHLKNDMSEK